MISKNPFKWRKYVLFRKLGKVTKYAGGFSIPVRVTSDLVSKPHNYAVCWFLFYLKNSPWDLYGTYCGLT